MKKIIAMLLCVAMIAAIAISAYADVKVEVVSSKKLTSIEDWITELNKPVTKTDLQKYAEALTAAKAVATAGKDALNDALKAAKDAIQAAQYVAIAQAYVDALVDYTNEVNKAIAQLYVDLGYTADPITIS